MNLNGHPDIDCYIDSPPRHHNAPASCGRGGVVYRGVTDPAQCFDCACEMESRRSRERYGFGMFSSSAFASKSDHPLAST